MGRKVNLVVPPNNFAHKCANSFKVREVSKPVTPIPSPVNGGVPSTPTGGVKARFQLAVPEGTFLDRSGKGFQSRPFSLKPSQSQVLSSIITLDIFNCVQMEEP